jgi:hypothetical protein
MPLNIAETNRSGDYWAQAINSFGQNMSGIVHQYAETKKQVNANNAFFKMSMPAEVAAEATKQKPGESMTEFAARQDAIKNATLFKMQKEKADAEMEETRARIAAVQAQNNQLQQNAFAQKAVGDMHFNNSMSAGGWKVPQPTALQRQQKYIDAGGNDRGVLDSLDNQVKSESASGQLGPERYRTVGGMINKDGTYLGQAMLDNRTGDLFINGKGGERMPVPEGAEPVTATSLQKDIPSVESFKKMRMGLTDKETSLRKLDRYLSSQESAAVGIQRIADKFSAGMKTLFGKDELTKQELALKVGQGQLQGLIGANRIAVVGGGVMTEQDALRVIEALGGDFSALSNPEVVKEQIANLYMDTYKQYQDEYNFHNGAVQDYYGARGFKKAEPIKFNAQFTADDMQQLLGGGGAAPADQTQKPAMPAGWSIK